MTKDIRPGDIVVVVKTDLKSYGQKRRVVEVTDKYCVTTFGGKDSKIYSKTSLKVISDTTKDIFEDLHKQNPSLPLRHFVIQGVCDIGTHVLKFSSLNYNESVEKFKMHLPVVTKTLISKREEMGHNRKNDPIHYYLFEIKSQIESVMNNYPRSSGNISTIHEGVDILREAFNG